MGVGVAVGSGVAVGVAVGLGVRVGWMVRIGRNVGVGLAVGTIVAVGPTVGASVAIGAGVGVSVGAGADVGTSVAVGAWSAHPAIESRIRPKQANVASSLRNGNPLAAQDREASCYSRPVLPARANKGAGCPLSSARDSD